MSHIQVTLEIPQEVYQRAQRVAIATKRKVTDVITTSIVLEDIVEIDSADETETTDDEAVTRERAAFIALHPLLLKKYKGEQVAIHGGQLVDHDVDGVALSRRVYQRFPDEFVWIAPVTNQPVEEWVVRSPRFEAIQD